jgi:tetratricopeptide (TPR) repeat protein
MKAHELLSARKYTDAIIEYRRALAKNPDDMGAVEGIAEALRAEGEYRESLSFFERLQTQRREDERANRVPQGSDAWQIDIACLYWFLGNISIAIQRMHGLAAGILDGSIKYGDAAGGMTQGLLLYYMAVTAKKPDKASFALTYMRNRIKKSFLRGWPRPVAEYYLGDATFDDVMGEVNRQRVSPAMMEAWKIELGKRRRLTVALFHDGVRSRARGDEEQCRARMRECYGLENPLLEQEWYLSRHEVQQAGQGVKAKR